MLNRRWLGMVTLLLLGLWSLNAASKSNAAENQDVQSDVLKVADTEEKGGDAKSDAATIASKADLGDVMTLLKLRSKKGLGVGSSPGAVKPDGIEALVVQASKQPLPASDVQANSQALARAGYVMAAIADIAAGKTPKAEGNKNPQKWAEWSQEMHTEALNFAQAAKSQDANALNAAAGKLNTTCNACHAMFRD